MAKLTSMQLWKLADSLSVVNAAILIAGGDPSERSWDGEGNHVQHTWQHEGYDAAFNALRTAILANIIKADISHSARGYQPGFAYDDQPYEIFAEANEERLSYNMLIARNERSGGYDAKRLGQTRLNFSLDTILSEQYLYICKEPNWEQTMVEVEDLKKWLRSRNVLPEFFFQSGTMEGFRNNLHPRYSAKLACAVAAWEAVKKPINKKSVKQTLQDWIQSNGVRFGVGENSVVSQTAAEEIAKIANWNIKGGATATNAALDENEDEKPVENFAHGHPEISERDLDIPF